MRDASLELLQKKTVVDTTPRSSKPLFPDSADHIEAEIEVSQRGALRQHSRKALGACCVDHIEAEIEVSERCALRQHSCKALCKHLCPACPDGNAAEIEVSQRCALCQHSYKPICPGCANPIEAELDAS
jgi:hypothetical protein